MIPVVVLGWLGYTAVSYSIILFRGWDVTLNQWANPLQKWTWPAQIKCIGDANVFPTGAGVDCSPATSGTGPGGSTPIPGSSAVKPKIPGKCPKGYLWDGSKCLQELA